MQTFTKRILICVRIKQACKLEEQLTMAENQCKNCRGLYKRLETLEEQLIGIQSERRTKLQELSQLRYTSKIINNNILYFNNIN